MIPVKQTRTGLGDQAGNCFEACVASLLSVSIEKVPDFESWEAARTWLEGQGWRLEQSRGHGDPVECGLLSGYSIAAVLLPSGTVHSVVCCDNRVVHDPSLRATADNSSPVLLWTQLRKIIQ